MRSSFPSPSGVSPGNVRLVLFAGLIIFTALLLPLLAAPDGRAASAQRVDLGAENLERLTPNCGRNFSRDCVAEGKVTIFQSKAKGYSGRPFVVPFKGKLVTWSISLADVTRKEISVGPSNNPVVHSAQKPFFDDIFGAPASARVAVLKQVEKKAKGAPKFKLVRQTPVEILNPYFGTTATFALTKPLNVVKGQVIALTVPTWAPAMWKPRACNAVYDSMLDPDKCDALFKHYAARTSRTPRGADECRLGRDAKTGEPNEPLAKSRPQTGIDSVRRYGCYYGPQAMLYSATVVGPKS